MRGYRRPMPRGCRLTRPAAAAATAALSLFILPQMAEAQAGRDTLGVAQAVAIARTANPMLQAARLRADAALERVPQAGAPADPQLSFGLMNRPLSGFGTGEPMTMNQVQLTQMLSWPGTLRFRKQSARHLALALGYDADEAEAMLVARVKAVYYEAAFMDRSLEIMERTRGLLRDFLQVSQALYSVGTGLQQDVLQAQVTVARMTEDITVMTQDRIAMGARLNALLGRDATVPIGGLELPPPGEAPLEVDALMALAAERRPALRAARARVEAAEAAYRAARRELYPEFMLGLAYGQRPQFDDMATVMIGVRVPLWAGARQLPMRREMLAMQAMDEAEARDLMNETLARLTELRAEAERARRLAQLYATAVLPQARAAVESALSAYRVGRVDYMTLVENEMTVNRYEIATVRLTADYHRALAELEALVGGLGGGQ